MINTKTSLNRASRAISELLPVVMGGVQLDFFLRTGITSSQIIVLMKIYTSKRLSMGELASAMGVSMPTVSGIVTRLVNMGYIRRYHDAEDRRKVYAEINVKGERLIAEFKKIVMDRWESVLKKEGANQR